MTNQTNNLDRVFHALSDPTRRAVLSRLAKGPAAVSELAQPFDMSLPSFTQHLSVLEDCKLVKSKKSGRVRTFELTPAALSTAETWLEQQRTLWADRLDRLDTYLKTFTEPQP